MYIQQKWSSDKENDHFFKARCDYALNMAQLNEGRFVTHEAWDATGFPSVVLIDTWGLKHWALSNGIPEADCFPLDFGPIIHMNLWHWGLPPGITHH